MTETYQGNAYCVKCKEIRDMFNGVVKVSDSGRRMAQGVCPTCGTKVNRILGTPTPNYHETVPTEKASTPMIIGLSGYAQSGKDTVAGMLMGLHKYERVAFADKIRELLLAMDPFVYANDGYYRLEDVIDTFGWEVAKVRFPEVRRLLQDLGVGGRTIFGTNHWIVEALKDIARDKKVIVTDVRFTNEASFLKDVYGAQIWRVVRPGVGAVNGHPSESQMDDWTYDAVIQNDGDLDDLKSKIKNLLG